MSLTKPVAAHFSLFGRELPSKTKRRMVQVLLSSEATLPRHLLRRRSGVLSLFHFASSFVCVSFCLWSLSVITCLHDSQTTYTPFLGHKHVKQYRRTTLASKGNKQKKCDLNSRRVLLCQHTCRTQRPCQFQEEARFL